MVQLLGGNTLDILRLLFLLLVVSGDVERNPGPLKTAASEGDLFRIEKIISHILSKGAFTLHTQCAFNPV